MFCTKLSVVTKASALVAVTCAVAFLTGCAVTTPPDKTATWSPNKIYAEAKDEAGSGYTAHKRGYFNEDCHS